MANLSHIFKPGQKVRCNFDGIFYKGTITKTDVDYIIVDIPEISDHCRFENNFNIGDVYPEYNFDAELKRDISKEERSNDISRKYDNLNLQFRN